MRRSLRLSTLVLSSLLAGPALAAPSGAAGARARFLDVGRLTPAVALEPGALEAAARGALAARIGGGLALGPARQKALASGERVVRLGQRHRGLPVAQRGAAVTFAADGVARLVAARLEDDLPDDVTPSFDAAAAASRASAFSPLALGPGQARLAIWPAPDGGRLAYVVSGRPVAALPIAPVVVIDARSGELLVRYDAATSLNQAKMYATNPTKSPALDPVTLPVKAGETHLSSDAIIARNCIDKQEVKNVSVYGFQLDVHVCALDQTATADANGDFLIDPPDDDTAPEDAFAEVSMFHHTSRILERFRQFDPSLEVQPGGAIEAIANLRVPQGFSSFDLNKIKDPTLPLAPFQ
ncbi:MAG: hypothetical protein EOO75_19945, partial [Myxococcales bacterium]